MTMKNCLRLLLALCGMLFASALSAQVPSMLNYQGRIAVSGVNFDGTGLFKFALVNNGGTQTYWSNDGTSTAGSEPTAAVSIDVDGGIYSVKLGDTSLTNMTAVPATVFANTDVRLRVWFNDGVNGSQLMSPDQRIAAVGYAMMANTVQDGAITSAKIATGAVGSSQLAPGAVTSALQAANVSAVAAGGIIGSNDPNNAALLAAGFVRDAGQLSTSDSWTPLPTGDAVAGHTAVWTGTELIFWGGVVPSGASGASQPVSAINRGVKYNPTTGVWTPISTQGAPQARFDHTAVWTGTEMIVFGGQTTATSGSGVALNTGGRYNPATDTWSFLAPLVSTPGNMADNRRGHFASWTGTKMLVWGGSSTGDYFASGMNVNHNQQGKIYDPATNAWSDMSMGPGELSTSGYFTSVWTGSQMIIWAGQSSSSNPAYAGRYNPTTDTWQSMSTIPGDPILPNRGYTLVWSGTEAIFWGGGDGASLSSAGYRYNPTTDSWTTMTTTGTPTARQYHVAAWVGTEFVIWGGKGPSGPGATFFNDGGRYNPTTDTWTSIASTGSPASRQYASANAVSGQLIVWGGVLMGDMNTNLKFHKNGGKLNPTTGAWTTIMNGSPAPRAGHSMIWTGTEVIIWGGTTSTMTNLGFDPTFADGARFNPATGVWTPLSNTNAPSGRYGHSTVWTGTEMIVWGGQRLNASNMNEMLNTGARYNPSTDTWTATDNATAPTARSQHTAMWTGSKMIIWGGGDGMAMSTNTGSLYDAAANTWTATSTIGGPMQGSSQHYAFWSGTDMIVIGEFGPGGSNFRYNPNTDAWTLNAAMPFPAMSLRSTTTAQWTGTDILLGYYQASPPFQLQSYSSIANFWQALSGNTSLSLPYPASVWTGSEMIVFGTSGTITPVFQAARYSATAGTWSSISTIGAPTRLIGGAVWTGSEMILWGGKIGSGPGNETTAHDTGSRYRLPQNYYFYRRP